MSGSFRKHAQVRTLVVEVPVGIGEVVDARVNNVDDGGSCASSVSVRVLVEPDIQNR